jgi:predicted acyltransferase (DUF342 family)
MEERVDMKADFAMAFREQVRGWLRQFGGLRPGEKIRTLNLGTKRLLMVEALVCPPNYAVADVLLVLGDLHAGPGCWFAGPVLVGGACEIGKDSRVMALAAGAKLTLGDECEVSDWVDSNGPLVLGGGSRVRGGAASRHSVQIGKGVEAGGVFGPAISSPEFAAGARMPELRDRPVEILPPGSLRATDWTGCAGIERSRLRELGNDTWIYDGALRFEKPVILKSKLVTRGSFLCAGASLLEEEVNAGGDIFIGANSIVNGNLSSKGDLRLDKNCLFSGDLSAGVTVTLETGTRGYRDGAPVVVSSGAALYLANNVLVRGEMQTGAGVRHRVGRGDCDRDLVLANA